LYHAQPSDGVGAPNGAFDIGFRNAQRCGLSERRAREVLLPLVASTVAHSLMKRSGEGADWEFRAVNVATVERHLGVEKAMLPEAPVCVRLAGPAITFVGKARDRSGPWGADQISRILATFVV